MWLPRARSQPRVSMRHWRGVAVEAARADTSLHPRVAGVAGSLRRADQHGQPIPSISDAECARAVAQVPGTARTRFIVVLPHHGDDAQPRTLTAECAGTWRSARLSLQPELGRRLWGARRVSAAGSALAGSGGVFFHPVGEPGEVVQPAGAVAGPLAVAAQAAVDLAAVRVVDVDSGHAVAACPADCGQVGVPRHQRGRPADVAASHPAQGRFGRDHEARRPAGRPGAEAGALPAVSLSAAALFAAALSCRGLRCRGLARRGGPVRWRDARRRRGPLLRRERVAVWLPIVYPLVLSQRAGYATHAGSPAVCGGSHFACRRSGSTRTAPVVNRHDGAHRCRDLNLGKPIRRPLRLPFRLSSQLPSARAS